MAVTLARFHLPYSDSCVSEVILMLMVFIVAVKFCYSCRGLFLNSNVVEICTEQLLEKTAFEKPRPVEVSF